MHPMWGMWGVWGIGMIVMMLVFRGALDILRQRYARGAISKEEFETKKKDLA